MTLEEYLQLEMDADTKYGYHDGAVFALAGGTLNHGWICGSIFGELRSGLQTKKRDCRAMSSEIKLYIESENSYVYPDALVICGEVEQGETVAHSVTNPIIIVEVLSNSTANYDRGDKFYMYRQIKSLQEYVLIEQDKPQVEIYKKQGAFWQITMVKGLDQKVHFSSIDLEIEMAAIYEGCIWEE